MGCGAEGYGDGCGGHGCALAEECDERCLGPIANCTYTFVSSGGHAREGEDGTRHVP
eukprot:COSAG02_NODE_2627_length_8394_cov_8.718143_6_plen_57_part_00